MPRILPVGGRGPYAVGIATEHIRTPVTAVGEGAQTIPSEEELWPLELMAQVSEIPTFYFICVVIQGFSFCFPTMLGFLCCRKSALVRSFFTPAFSLLLERPV